MKELVIDYSGTGIKGFIVSTVVLVVFILAAVVSLAFATSKEAYIGMAYAAGLTIFGWVHYVALRALATIAENALYQKTKLEEELRDGEVTIRIKKETTV